MIFIWQAIGSLFLPAAIFSVRNLMNKRRRFLLLPLLNQSKMSNKELNEFTNTCYQGAVDALNNLIANIAPAAHATKPLSGLIEEMKQSMVAMHINAKTIINKI